MALKDYFLTDSNKSVMRLSFFITICTGLLISVASSVFTLIAALQGKVMDLSSIVTIVGLLVGGSFLGKAGQTFGESIENKNKPL